MNHLYNIFIIVFIISSSGLIAETILINGSKKSINLKQINNTDYIQINELAKLLDVNALCNDNNIKYNNESLKFALGSFFVVYENDDLLRVAQMNLPVIELNYQTFIPFNSFINSMQGIGLLEYKYSDKTLIISSNIVKSKKHNPDRVINDKSNMSIKNDSEVMKSKQSEKPKVSDSIKENSNYIIPKRLKK
ncbi:MAG: hypothetical protein KIT33_06820 [Candidatus Kapabacteria bacterium]|nr:hypothetical protein [Ignavibacteriota bacterium]MCW5884668.1 hypothetical protein [Candidatus Kapabacteria bacterium]